MSWEATTWVLEHSTTTGNAKVILIGLANHAHPDGTHAFPTVETLQRYAGGEKPLDRRTVQRRLRELERDRHIERTGIGPNGQAMWRVRMGAAECRPRQTAAAAPAPPGGAAAAPPEPPVEPPTLSTSHREGVSEPTTPPLDESELQRAAREPRPSATRRVTYRRRPVPPPVVEEAEQLLAVFNDATHSRLAATAADGGPSPGLRQIIGALLERPDTLDVWERGVRAMVADPPNWIDGPFIVGHIFGPNAAEHTLARGRGQQPATPRWRGRRPRAADFQALKTRPVAA